jgi:hypothetical protein
MIIVLRELFASDSMDKTERNGRRGRQSRQGRQPIGGRLTAVSENKTARRIQSVRTPSKRQAIVPTSNCKPTSGDAPERHLRTSQGEKPFDVECKNEGRTMSSTAVAEVVTSRVEQGGRRRGMSAKVVAPTPRKHPCRHSSVPSVVYVTPQRHPHPPTRRSAKPADLKAHPRLELEEDFCLDIDASTISASPSTHSLSNAVVDLECMVDQRKRSESARFGESESKDAAAPRPPRRLPSRKLNPNAPIYVPGQEEKLRSSPRRTLARAFCRPSPPKTGDALETSGRDVQRHVTRIQNPRTPLSPAPRSTFPAVHQLARLSRHARTAPKVTVVSEEFKVFVIDLLPEEDCDWVLQSTEQHVADAAIMRRETWRKIYTHTCLDLPCCEVLTLRPLTNHVLMQIRQIVGKTWKARRAASCLVPRSWKEPHLLRYQKIPGQQEHDHTGMIMHYDGGDLSWHLMLSTQGVDYTGESSSSSLIDIRFAVSFGC